MQTWFKKILILVFVAALTNDFAFAQKIPVTNDSTKVYKNIESFSVKRKSTRFVYELLFRPVVKNQAGKHVKKKVYKKLIKKPYSAFEGKIIRNINITTLDPFGNSIADTIVRRQNTIIDVGNKIHIKSQHITIRNLLLFRQNQEFDSLLVKESERLIRSERYVTDVSFFVNLTARNSDSVDINIRELDNWSLIPGGGASTTSISANFTEKNFLGLGHELKPEFTWNDAAGRYAYKVNYYIPNFRNTYINSTFHLGREESGNFSRSFAIDRPFFSPFARWAAGAVFAHQFRRDYIHGTDSLLIFQPFRFNVQDYWAGNATRIFKGSTEYNRTTNFITALRFYRVRYIDKPAEEFDRQHFFADENFYLASVGVSARRYVQDKYIFKFGITEDVPVGVVYSFTGGYQVKNGMGRIYLGSRASSGHYYPWGYLGFNCEYGTFLNKSRSEQGVFTVALNYFTGIMEAGKWKFRQFVKPQFTIGIHRFDYDSITINDGFGLDGFNSTALSGSRRMLLTFQTQSYSPWNFVGFRFGPYFTFSLGMLGNEKTGFKNSNVYSQIGVGVLIKNDHLIINTFQISFAYYPSIPGRGQNVFKGNSFRSADFGFRDFEIGKPAVVLFQ